MLTPFAVLGRTGLPAHPGMAYLYDVIIRPTINGVLFMPANANAFPPRPLALQNALKLTAAPLNPTDFPVLRAVLSLLRVT